jgi:stage III sporulation protein AB
MLILKWIGGICVFLGCSLLGWYRAYQLQRRVVWIQMALHGLQRLETEIVYAGTPLVQAIHKIAELENSSKIPKTFFACLSLHLKNELSDFRNVWQMSVQAQQHSSAAARPELDVMSQLGFTLGSSDRDDQIKHLKLTYHQLQSALQTATEDQTKYQSMWRTVGMLAGALLVIVMI